MDRVHAVLEPFFAPALHVVPFIQHTFCFRVTGGIQFLTHDFRAIQNLLRLDAVNMPGEKVHGGLFSVLGQSGKEVIHPVADTPRKRRTADLHVRETGFQMRRCDLVKFIIFRSSTAPAALVRGIVFIQIRLVPDFPVLNIMMVTIRPTLIVVGNDVFADHRPLFEVRRRKCVILFRPMFNGGAETVIRFRACVQCVLNKNIRQQKVVVRRIFRICIEIAENIGNIHAVRSAVGGAVGRIMVPGEGDTRRLVRIKISSALIVPRTDRPVIHGVHRLDHAHNFTRIQFQLCHNFFLSISG